MTALDGLTPLQLSACLPYFLQTTFLTKRRAFTGRSGTLDVSLPEHPEGQRVLAVAGLLRRYMSLLNQSLLSTTISCRARAPECLPTCCRPSTRMSPSTPRVTPPARPSSLPIAMLGARTSGGTRSGPEDATASGESIEARRARSPVQCGNSISLSFLECGSLGRPLLYSPWRRVVPQTHREVITCAVARRVGFES